MSIFTAAGLRVATLTEAFDAVFAVMHERARESFVTTYRQQLQEVQTMSNPNRLPNVNTGYGALGQAQAQRPGQPTAPRDTDLKDILTIQARVVMVTSSDAQDEAAVESFRQSATNLLALMRALGDRRCSMKVEWRKGVDAWTSVEISTDDIEGLQGQVADLGRYDAP
jgi:hypothetical protein